MRAEECVGKTGRTLTEVATAGRVEVAGESFDAMTVGPAIPAGETVEVTGWRLGDGSNAVLSVRVPRPGESPGSPPPPRPRTADERLDELLQRGAAQSRRGYPVAGVGGLFLTFGQVVSVLSCAATPIYAIVLLVRAAQFRAEVPSAPNVSIWIILGAVATFAYSAAMAVVFSRVKQLPPLA